MLYKDDWDDARRRFIAWWQGGQLDRPAMAFTTPRDRPLPAAEPPPLDGDPRSLYLDLDHLLAAAEKRFAGHRFFGEAFPNIDYNLGAGSMALYLGGEPRFAWDTLWFKPIPELVEDPERVALPEYDPDNPWWRRHLAMARRAADFARGRCLATIPDIVEGIDILAALRGPQKILMDLYDRPQWVHRWLDRLEQLYWEYFERFYQVVKDETGGHAFTAFQVWAPGRMAKVQCDFSAMIGPDAFAEFVVPTLARQCDKLDYSVYHLDGPECIPHTPHLLGIEALNAIQYTPGTRNPGLGDPCWFDFYRQVLDGGKSLLLLGLSEEEACRIAGEIGTQGVFFYLHSPATEKQGEELLQRVQDWGM